jgi:hypothetical protein
VKNWCIIGLSVLALLSFLASHTYLTSVVVHFAWNQEEIAAEHCVNQDKPELHCNGSCYLAEQLESAPNAHDPASESERIQELQSPVICPSVQYFGSKRDFRAEPCFTLHLKPIWTSPLLQLEVPPPRS